MRQAGQGDGPKASVPIFRFGTFTLDVERYELTGADGKALALPRLAMELLLCLVRGGGRLMTRGEIAAALWPGSDPEDVTQSINTAVNRIRLTLADDPGKPAYVQTVIGRGYRFIADVRQETPVAIAVPPPEARLIHAPEPVSLEKLHEWYVSSAPIEMSVLRVDARTTVLALRGALRLGPGLKVAEMQIHAEIGKGVLSLVLDLAAVPLIDSAGLGLLIHVFSLLRENGGTLRLCGVTDRAMSLLRMTRTDAYLAIDADVSASLAKLAEARENGVR